MIMIELVSAKIGFQLLLYIYAMIFSMSRGNVKNIPADNLFYSVIPEAFPHT